MKTKFFEYYYKPTKEEFKQLIEDSLLVFDTNVLLDVLRLPEDSANELLELFSSKIHQIWIPYRVAQEFHTDITNVMGSQIKVCDDVLTKIVGAKNFLDQNRLSWTQAENKEIYSLFNDLIGKLKLIKEKKVGCLHDNSLLIKMGNIFSGKVGDAFTQEELDDIQVKGKERYDKKRPPGYKDESKGGKEQYGDLVIWKEIIKKAKEERKSIIYLTNDTKGDWFIRYFGRTLGPRPELIREFRDETKKEGEPDILFYCYTSKFFLQILKDIEDAEVSEGLLKNLSMVRQEQANNSNVENTGYIDGPNNHSETISNSSGQTGNNNSAP